MPNMPADIETYVPARSGFPIYVGQAEAAARLGIDGAEMLRWMNEGRIRWGHMSPRIDNVVWIDVVYNATHKDDPGYPWPPPPGGAPGLHDLLRSLKKETDAARAAQEAHRRTCSTVLLMTDRSRRPDFEVDYCRDLPDAVATATASGFAHWEVHSYAPGEQEDFDSGRGTLLYHHKVSCWQKAHIPSDKPLTA